MQSLGRKARPLTRPPKGDGPCGAEREERLMIDKLGEFKDLFERLAKLMGLDGVMGLVAFAAGLKNRIEVLEAKVKLLEKG